MFTPKEIRRRLEEVATEEYREGSRRYFKETIDPIGASVPDIRRLAREVVRWCKQEGRLKAALKLAKPLWKKGKWDEKQLAVVLLTAFSGEFDDGTWVLFDKWVDDLEDWATCDAFSTDVIGPHLDGYPERRRAVLKWTKSKNLWRRRAAAVSFVRHARKGKYLSGALRVAAPLVSDEEDMVRKGVGWVLREAARTAPQQVVDFCKKHEHNTARLILRTASETMPERLKRELLGERKRKK